MGFDVITDLVNTVTNERRRHARRLTADFTYPQGLRLAIFLVSLPAVDHTRSEPTFRSALESPFVVAMSLAGVALPRPSGKILSDHLVFPLRRKERPRAR